MNYLADFITGLSLICGLVSIIFSLEGNLALASWAIIIAVIFDGLDGQVARRNYPSTEFGKEFDSLTDLVSFGVAPFVLGYSFVYKHFSTVVIAVLSIYMVCSVRRLAKYNAAPKVKLVDYFYGLPITVSGGALASFVLVYKKYTPLLSPLTFLLIALALSLLMISNLRYPNIDGLKRILGKSIFPIIVIALIVVLFLPEIAIFMFFLVYLISSPFLAMRIM